MKKYRCKHCYKIVTELEKEQHRKYCTIKINKDPVDFLKGLFGMGKK